jgi:subtilisin family serine protease
VLIAATGNDSAPTVSYPASDPNVIAITAVDIAGRRYRQANRGAEVDFAAPGVDLLVDDGTWPRHLSGTSYATAVGTAVAAHLLAGGAKNSAEVNAQLKASAEDLGPVGHDDSFGWGLMRTSGLCQ